MKICELIMLVDPMNQICIRNTDDEILFDVDDPYNNNIVDSVLNSGFGEYEIVRLIPHSHCLIIITDLCIEVVE